MTKQRLPHVEPQGGRGIQHRLIFAVSFALCVLAGTVGRLWPNFRREASYGSLFAEAWEASLTITQLAFAG